MNTFDKRIGKNIREIRKQQGLSQEKLARGCDISCSQLSLYENGRKIPGLCSAAKIARCLGVSIDHLIYGDEANAFINSAPDEGRKIVNCIYELWKADVIWYWENHVYGSYPMTMMGEGQANGYFLEIKNYPLQIKRLISLLDDYRSKISTYDEPEKYLEMILGSAAQEINEEIKRESRPVDIPPKNEAGKKKA